MKTNYRRKNRTKASLTGSKVFDWSCRNHGRCGWCESNRLHHRHKIELFSKLDLDYWMSENALFHLFDDDVYYWDNDIVCWEENHDNCDLFSHFDLTSRNWWKKYVNNGKSRA